MTDATAALAALSCAANAPKLSDAELAAHLEALPGWSRAGNALEKEFRFPDFARTIAFVNSVASRITIRTWAFTTDGAQSRGRRIVREASH